MTKDYKYEEVVEYILERIENGTFKTGKKIESEIDLAEQLNVSRQTIRRAIKDLTEKGILYSIRGKGTFVSEKKESKDSKLIGVMFAYLNYTMFPRVLSGIDKINSSTDYSLLWYCTKNDVNREAEYINKMIEAGVSAVIAEPTKSAIPSANIYLYEKLEQMGIPVLFMSSTYPNYSEGVNYVVVDDEDAGYKATKYLIDNGHTEIGGIFKSDDLQGHKRHAGFIRALTESGIRESQANVVWLDTSTENNIFDEEIIKHRFQKKLKHCTGIVCYNDDVALILYKRLEELGLKVPDDYSLVGFDNSRLSDMFVTPITSITHPKKEIGLKIAYSIIDMIENDTKVQESLIVNLIEKESVKRIK